ncbi:xanthine dehydrogenase molybdopterin binding subunit [Sabulicella glaciei]|uniref:Xanthine dehydrogenase molybdopterin binding subunit n=1 Tax=Sabulicella glaciei TaxID=2984948 RepID=A0ABT3NQM7_9PROT|nr:xanthine dehydrogenase molybdopterin binding subunit [Roseococcus sp. MDT2-1-1]MCW8084456.1 xanthine dehydrogenase molybdopterin binding subunit [Roseococcus sp. MDT2-1-1]
MNTAIVGHALRHDSALLHASGGARFLDDLPEPAGTWHAALALSPVAHGRLLGLDLPEGVRAILPADIPGENDIAPIGQGEVLLVENLIEHHGQPLALLVAPTRDAALRAAAATRAHIEALPPILSIEAALEAGTFLVLPQIIAEGDVEAALAAAPHRLAGEFRAGGQEHFYLEGQIALAIPGEEDEMLVHSSTQHPTEVQHVVSRVLGVPFHRVTVQCRRLGGGFGGKESNASSVAAAAALAARVTGRPVKLRLPRRSDMAATGKRHPFLYRWQAGFDEMGRLLALDAILAADGGHSLDMSGGVVFRALTHALNCYGAPALRISACAVKTNHVSNTAFRGFGGPQGALLMEDVLHQAAAQLGHDVEALRLRNLADRTPYGQALEPALTRRVLAEAKADAEWDRRRADAASFNATHPTLRRGVGAFCCAFGIAFGIPHLNQAGALVHVYTDGSIRLAHGGTEMGQGLFIKVAQVVAEVFGVPVETVGLAPTSTAEIPNTSATAASTGSDLNGWAAHAAAVAVRDRMAEVAARHFGCPPEGLRFEEGHILPPGGNAGMRFGELAKLCWRERVSLSATGFYRTPDIHWDAERMRGEPFFYFAYGAAVAEVLLDTLTGEHRCLSAHLVQDCGRSLNPAIDLGQIEGAFVQGLGWLTSEELWWDHEGRQRTLGPSTYKIPGSRDVPPVLRARLLEGSEARDGALFRSKAVGEPPLLLATAVVNALRDATAVASLDLPATPERVHAALRHR